MRYATALADWGDHGGYDAEVHWDECITRAVGLGLTEVADRPLRTFSGGEQKRIALEVLLRGDDDILLLDEPDNFLDVPAKRWLERELATTRKTVLYVSHDRELLAATATQDRHDRGRGRVDPRRRVRRLRRGPPGPPRQAQHATARGTTSERERLEELVAEMSRRARISDAFAPKLKAAESRLRLFVEKQRATVGGARAAASTCAWAAPAPASGR